ncbi:cysteine-rich receptor-like protein kinase 8 [Tanacetum coccineum]
MWNHNHIPRLIKCNSDGSIERFKAILVAKGFTQKEGIDYNETFAPVAKMVTVRTFIVVVVHHNWHIAQLDINNAFLHGDLHKEVYMTLPQGYKPNSNIQNPVCKLQKSLYGLKQTNRQWFIKLTTFLTHLGFNLSYADTSLLTYKKNKDFLALVIYIDDILLTGSNNHPITHFKQQLDQQFSIKDLGNINYYLGIEFLINKQGVTMTQRKYALELIHTAGVLDLKSSHIPIDPNVKLNDSDEDPLPNASIYRTLVVNGLIAQSLEDPSLVSASFWSLLQDLQTTITKPVPIFCDNQSSIALALNPVQHARTKHIEIDCHFVRDKIKNGLIYPTFVPSNQQAADVFTKGLSRAPFHTCISKLGMCDPYTLPTCRGLCKTDISGYAGLISQTSLARQQIPQEPKPELSSCTWRWGSENTSCIAGREPWDHYKCVALQTKFPQARQKDLQKTLTGNRMAFYKEQWEIEEGVAENELHQITFHDVFFGSKVFFGRLHSVDDKRLP